MSSDKSDKVFFDNVIVANDGTVMVFLTDKSRFEYDDRARTWREISPAFEWPQDAVTDNYPVLTSQGHPLQKLIEVNKEPTDHTAESIAALIGKLER